MATITAGDINLSTSFDAEFRDTFSIHNNLTETNTTDYKRPLFVRADSYTTTTGFTEPEPDQSDRYGVDLYNRGVCLPFHPNIEVAPTNPINHIGNLIMAAGYDFTEIPIDATITSAEMRITVKQPNGGNSSPPPPYDYTPTEDYVFDGTYYGAMRVVFDYNGGGNSQFGDTQTLVDGDFNTYTFTIPVNQYTFGGTYSPLGSFPRFLIQFYGVYDSEMSAGGPVYPAANAYGQYEISNIEARINYTGRTYRTTGFLRQDLDTLIPDPENYNYKYSNIIVESNYAGEGYSANYEIHFVNDTADNLLNGEIFPDPSYERYIESPLSVTQWVNGTATNPTREVLLYGVTRNTDDLESTGRGDKLDITDITTAGFKVRYYNISSSSYMPDSNFTLLAPRVNVALQPFIRGEADLSASINVATPGTMIHGVINSEIEAYGNEFTLENTGLAGLIRTGFTIDPSSNLVLQQVTAHNLIGDYPNTALNTAIDFSNTGLAGLIRTGYTVPMSTEISIADTDTNLEITAISFKFSDIAVTLGATAVSVEHTTDIDLAVDVAQTTVAINQQTAPAQGTYTAPTETRDFLIALQGEDRADERRLYVPQQTRQYVIPLQGEDTADQRVLYVGTQTRTIPAEAMER